MPEPWLPGYVIDWRCPCGLLYFHFYMSRTSIICLCEGNAAHSAALCAPKISWQASIRVQDKDQQAPSKYDGDNISCSHAQTCNLPPVTMRLRHNTLRLRDSSPARCMQWTPITSSATYPSSVDSSRLHEWEIHGKHLLPS